MNVLVLGLIISTFLHLIEIIFTITVTHILFGPSYLVRQDMK